MRLIIEKLDDEVYIDLIITEADFDRLREHDIVTEEAVFQGKVFNFGIRKQLATEDLEEDFYNKWRD